MSVTLACGHDTTNDPKYQASIRKVIVNGKRTITVSLVCRRCFKEYKRKGLVITSVRGVIRWIKYGD